MPFESKYAKKRIFIDLSRESSRLTFISTRLCARVATRFWDCNNYQTRCDVKLQYRAARNTQTSSSFVFELNHSRIL